MKKINFTKLSIRNFLSVGEEPVEIEFRKGTSVITGVNRDEDDIANGVGKSTVCSAFFFAIFGTTPNEIPKQHIMNRKAAKGCKVRLEFEDVSTKHGEEYFVIERTLGPNKVKVWKNDTEKTKSTIPETNKYIREVLSAAEEVFTNCVIMQSNNTIPFMGKKKVDRKNFIESIFNLSVFADMMKLLKEDLRGEKHDYDVNRSAQDVMGRNLQSYQAQIEQIRRDAAERTRRMDEERKSLEERIRRSGSDLEELHKREGTVCNSAVDGGKIREAQATLEENSKKIYGKKVELRTLSENLRAEKRKIEAIGNACHACGRPYDDDTVNRNRDRIAEIDGLLKGYAEAGEKLDTAQGDINAKIGKCRDMLFKIESAARECIKVQEDIKHAESTMALYREQLSALPEKYREGEGTKSFEELLESTRKEFEEKGRIIAEIEGRISRLNVCEHILGDMGVRSYIVKKLINMLNSRISFYLRSFKSTFRFTFNEFFEEEIKDPSDAVCTYNNCSGAEKKKIDLAISFAFMDILKYHRQIEYNLNFYDEILDSSVDSKSLEHIMEFITRDAEAQGKSVYIITHKQDIVIPKLRETVFLEKRNGFTTRMEVDG